MAKVKRPGEHPRGSLAWHFAGEDHDPDDYVDLFEDERLPGSMIASFEGPDSYWELRMINGGAEGSAQLWIYGPDGKPREEIANGIGRWYSVQRDWEDYE